MTVFFQDLTNYSSLAFEHKWQKKERERKRRHNGCRLSGGEIAAVGVKVTFDGIDKKHFFFFLRPAGTNSRRPLQRYLLLRRSLLCWKMTAEGHSECSHELISGNTLLTANLFQTHAGNHTGGDRLRQRLKRPEARLQTARQHRCWSARTMMSSRGKHQDKENRSRIIYSICCLC